ncbi:MAG: DNA polymerase III subunit alpha, partial [Candidatus Saccharibacteria bacterium]|nr:DNA polymerase III subunit alpha [Candidatus Saccharibacteria bacterium]
YGHDHVCNIVTFGTMASRSAVRDVARVLEVPYAESDRLSKLVPTGPQSAHVGSLSDCIKTDPDMKHEYETNPTAKRVYDFAIQLEGTIRSHGVHACGTVIAPEPLIDLIPLEVAQKGVITTQFPAPEVEEMGLLKMDFLGLSNLTIIDNCRRIIRKVYGEEVDLEHLPLDDEETFKLLQRGDTTGVFQLESAGMKRYLKELEPTRFDDIIAMVALYRPGPMQFIDTFIKRKHGLEEISYPHPSMQPQLEETYGVLVYQEQFMLISKACCGFTGGEADTLRKAVAKKKKALMDTMKSKFIDGGVKTVGADRAVMEKFWTELEDFASYCFNKSHAACYGLIAYWTAYLKAHYPDAFMAALMSSDSGDTDRLTIEISECNRLGLKVINPDINESFREFAVVKETNNIRFGLAAIKAVGSTAIDDILEQRKKDGPFQSIEDFAKRVNSRTCNRKVYESLIKAGAFDCFATPDQPAPNGFTGSRSDLLFNLDTIIAFAQKTQKETASGQGNLLDMLGGEVKGSVSHLELAAAPTQASDKEKLGWERELLGLYLSAHPLDKYETFLREQTNATKSLNSSQDGALVTIGGLISKNRTLITKSGTKMAFMTIEDKAGEVEVVIFPKTFEKMPQNIDPSDVVMIKGRISGKDKEGNQTPDPSVVADSVQIISDDVLAAYQPTGVPMGEVDMSTVGKKRRSGGSGSGRGGGNYGGGNYSSGGGYKSAGANAGGYAAKAMVKPGPAIDMSQYDIVDSAKPKILYIHVKDPTDGTKLVAMKEKVGEYRGTDQVILVLGEKENKSAIRMPVHTRICEELQNAIGNIFGSDCVAVR